MFGTHPTLQDIVLQEVPEAVTLYCDEELPPEEEPEDEDQQVPAVSLQSATDTFKVQVYCPHCDDILCVAVHCSNESIRLLEQLLLQDLKFICRACATSNYNGF